MRGENGFHGRKQGGSQMLKHEGKGERERERERERKIVVLLYLLFLFSFFWFGILGGLDLFVLDWLGEFERG